MDTPTMREAVALFDNPERLEQAVSDLQGHGFDRADISLVAPEALEQGSGSSERLAQAPDTQRDAPVGDTDIRQGRLLGTSMAAVIAAFAAAGFTVMTGVGVGLVVLAAVAAGGGIGAAGAMFGRKLGQDEEAFLNEQLARGGVLLWVRTATPDAEQRAIAVLRRHSTQVQVHDIPAEAHQPLPSDRA